MDRNTTLERRFSLNTTHIANPIAESTCLNINSKGSSTVFQWGGTPISPKNRSNSSICLSGSSKSNNYSTASGRNGTNSQFRSNVTIDPRVYADVQSKGLASRIVKYHEKGTCLTRSFSVNNLYTKPGQLPLVNLKKTELPKRVAASNVSMTRIAPPEKSMFYGNTLPSVLRSNSVVAMHKSDEEISRENRPILHPPPTENEMAPTRSVLEVLKEISRKRINSDHLDLDDSTKKYCSRDINEQTCVITQNAQQNNKRQREHLNGNMQFVQTSQNTINFSTTQHSPEHLAKKRLCSYNNDITSSLSSSQIHTNKRKFYDQTHNLMQIPTSLSVEEDDHRTTKRLQLQQSDARSEQLTLNNSSSYKPSLAEQNHNDDNVDKAAAETDAQFSRHNTSNVEVVLLKEKNLTKKKKLTLFNKDYDESKESKSDDRFAENAPFEKDDFCEIPFVKPKKTTSSTLTKNPIIERTQKSKLALMLKGLRGELYHSDEDQVDEAKNANEKKETSEKESKAADKPQLKSATTDMRITNNQIQMNAKSNVQSENISSTKPSFNDNVATPATRTLPKPVDNSISSTINTQSIAIAPIPTGSTKNVDLNTSSSTIAGTAEKINKTKSPLVGIKLTPQSPTTNNLFNATNANTGSSAHSKPSLTFNANPIVSLASTSSSGGFSFNFTQTPTIAAAATAESKNLPPKIDSLSSSTTFTSSTANAFTLPTTSSSSVFGQTTHLGTQSVKPFTFGSLAAPTVDNSQSAPKSSEYAAVKKIDFGQIGTTGTLSAAPTNPVELAPVATANPVTASTNSTTNGFSFGLKNTQLQKPSAVATPFSINSSGLSQQPVANAFTFGTTKSAEPANSTVKPGQITFGETAPSTNSFSFGAGASTSAPFSFGSNLTAKPPQAESSANSAKPVAFTFGSNSTSSLSANTNKSGGFSFGNSTATSTKPEQTSTNIFGSSNIQPSTVAPAFTFGGTEQPSTVAAPNSSNIFGASPLSAANSQNKTFTFGSSQNSLTSPKSETGGFSFNPVNKANSGGFSFTTKTAADACQPQSSLPAFSFGSLASKDGVNNDSKSFQTQIATAPNLFDNSALLNKTASSTPFNFTANATNNSSNVQTNTNLFAAPQQNTGVGGEPRHFRRATRRLQKS